ncbi:hypothetical protein LCGC14_3105870 [marine sediment metagenome]|uniref:Uncharacterized protein n=1 Tax=marine sediment metagenome TaxID=412755 RepID=A0A0F8W6T7_9ZZZZ
MDINLVIQVCATLVCKFSDKKSLQEFELLAYEQACRTLESVLGDFRKTWEATNEFENYS